MLQSALEMGGGFDCRLASRSLVRSLLHALQQPSSSPWASRSERSFTTFQNFPNSFFSNGLTAPASVLHPLFSTPRVDTETRSGAGRPGPVPRNRSPWERLPLHRCSFRLGGRGAAPVDRSCDFNSLRKAGVPLNRAYFKTCQKTNPIPIPGSPGCARSRGAASHA